jgi:hypothetical protein
MPAAAAAKLTVQLPPLLKNVEVRAPFVISTLLRVIMQADLKRMNPVLDGAAIRVALACDLIGKGFHQLFHVYIRDLMSLFRRLHQLSVVQQPAVTSAALRALMQLGKTAPQYFVTCMGKEALNARNSDRGRRGALLSIVDLVRKHPTAMARVLPLAVQIITRCLDPSEPKLRKSLLHSSTAALHVLVQKYPSVTFHQQTQRFAVGTGSDQKSVVIIYDLRTATKWRILEGHAGNVSAVSFSPSGSALVSYCADEEPLPTLRVWNTAIQGFFSSLLGSQGRCTQEFKLARLGAPRDKNVATADGKRYSLVAHYQTTNLSWTSDKNVTLTREDGSRCQIRTDKKK